MYGQSVSKIYGLQLSNYLAMPLVMHAHHGVSRSPIEAQCRSQYIWDNSFTILQCCYYNKRCLLKCLPRIYECLKTFLPPCGNKMIITSLKLIKLLCSRTISLLYWRSVRNRVEERPLGAAAIQIINNSNNQRITITYKPYALESV